MSDASPAPDVCGRQADDSEPDWSHGFVVAEKEEAKFRIEMIPPSLLQEERLIDSLRQGSLCSLVAPILDRSRSTLSKVTSTRIICR